MRDKPPLEVIAKNLLNSVGIKVEKTTVGIKFVYKNKQIIDDLEQLGFSIDVLKMRGGETPLPILGRHVDEQASLEAYWSAQAETARYQLSVAQDSYDFWFETKYAICFVQLQDRGVPKPTQNEVNARISKCFPKAMLSKKIHIRKLEHNYRMLHNACLASIVTKGKMLQTLRNIVQGSGYVKLPSVENETIGSDNEIDNFVVQPQARREKDGR